MWTDLNINFQQQTINHCCKQIQYPAGLDLVKQMGGRVFNENQKHREDRRIMVEEDRLPPSCEFCIRSEPNSIRHVWNQWNDKKINHIRNSLINAVHTSYIELDIGNKCDMACIYCGAHSSSTWAKELGIANAETEWDQWYASEWRKEILRALDEHIQVLDKETVLTFNLLGGEPLLLPYTYDMIEQIGRMCRTAKFEQKPTIMVTTNLNCKPKLLSRLKNVMLETSKYIRWVLSISIEDINERAEKTRFHLNWKRFEKNLIEIKSIPDFIYLTATINMFSLPYLDEFIDWAFNLLGHFGYARTWDFTMNSVQGHYTEVGYCYKDLIDIDKILHRYNVNLEQSGLLETIKSDSIATHIKNLYEQLETLEPDEEFWKFWNDRMRTRGIDYTELYPLKQIKERFNK